jgi:prepilin-type N-terminal cleavage/methylation domain-containing protein
VPRAASSYQRPCIPWEALNILKNKKVSQQIRIITATKPEAEHSTKLDQEQCNSNKPIKTACTSNNQNLLSQKPMKTIQKTSRILEKRNSTKDKLCSTNHGFTLTEAVVTTAIVATLGSIAYPNYTNHNHRIQQSEVKATIISIPPIIGAFVDATGETPSTWDDLSSIAAVMTNDGPATGDLGTPITLQNSIYNLSITGPAESVYTLLATRVIDETNDNLEEPEYKYAIKSCFNVSNGASDLRSGNLTDIESELNCG